MFGNTDEVEDEDEEYNEDYSMAGWGWSNTIFGLCNGDITKIDQITSTNHLLILNYLSWNIDKMEIQNARNKQ